MSRPIGFSPPNSARAADWLITAGGGLGGGGALFWSRGSNSWPPTTGTAQGGEVVGPDSFSVALAPNRAAVAIAGQGQETAMLGVYQQAAERPAARQCHGAHAADSRQLLRQPGEERSGFPRRIAVAYRVEGEHVQIIGVEAGIDPADVPVAADDETGDQQQHDGRGHLGYHEEVAQAEPPETAGPRGYAGLAAFFQRDPISARTLASAGARPQAIPANSETARVSARMRKSGRKSACNGPDEGNGRAVIMWATQ